jgi:hypothetical protein
VIRSLVVVLLVLAAASGGSDVVVLKSGKTLRGRILFDDGVRLVLRQERGGDAELEHAEIERAESRRANLDALLDNAARADLSAPDELELLAAQAEESGLPGEAQVFWWHLLLADRDHEDANRALGHVKRGGGWRLRLGGRTLDRDKRFALANDWGSAWELESLHYRLRSNLPLADVLTLLLDLERLYAAFHELIGAELGLYDVTQPMGVNLHADSASYPERAREFGHYEPDTDLVSVDASRTAVWPLLAHEATHQLLHVTAFREKNEHGEIPPWLNEGLAEYVAASAVRAPRFAFEAGRPAMHHFATHAGAKKPLDLTRVLALSSGDYAASSDRDLKYAQSYTLVHFLLHGREGRYRPGFFAYLREVYRGKGSVTDLKRALDTNWRELEDEWSAYARSLR